MSELNQIALKIISNGKGILAADESTGTMTKRLDSVNVKSTPENRLKFREALFSSKEMEKYIGGVILYDETIKQTSSSKIQPTCVLSMLCLLQKTHYGLTNGEVSLLFVRICNKLVS